MQVPFPFSTIVSTRDPRPPSKRMADRGGGRRAKNKKNETMNPKEPPSKLQKKVRCYKSEFHFQKKKTSKHENRRRG